MSDDTEAIRDAFDRFFARDAGPARTRAAETRDTPGFDPDLWQRARSLGVPALAVEGATLTDLATVAEAWGGALAPIPLVEPLVALRLVDRLRTPPDHEHVDGSAILTIALQPVVDHVAPLVPAGAVAAAVVARDASRVLLARAEAGPAPPTLDHAPVADVRLVDPTVLADGDTARAAFADALDEWRTLTGAALVGLAGRALEVATDYARGRHQFGAPIGSFQALQHRLADVATLVAAARLVVADAAAVPSPVAASRAFVLATRAARDAAGVAVHVHGGYGVMAEYDVQLFFRRASAWPLLLGDPGRETELVADRLEAQGWLDPEDPPQGLRAELRGLLADACTDEMIERVVETGTVHDWDLHRRLADAGFLTAGWPGEWGGAALDEEELLFVWEELQRAGAPSDGWGTSDLVARTLAIAGSEEQQREVVPGVLAGEILISLGYSEPDSGSDVAAATTRAEPDGDGWRINGQKMFTTMAHEAAYVFLLTRTNPEASKHRGLTLFLVPLDLPGIEITPIRTMSGERTNITYYNDVWVPDRARVGEVDGGWDVMRVALAFERNPTMVGQLDRLLRQFVDFGQRVGGLLQEPEVRRVLAGASIDLAAGRLLGRGMARITAEGGLPVVEGSMAKLWSSEALLRVSGQLLDALGTAGLLRHGAAAAPADGWIEHMARHAPVETIRGGTSEMQRTIIAERGLGLPRAGR